MDTVDFPKQESVSRPAAAEGEAQYSNKRRSSRVVIDIPVTVFGQDTSGKIFQEESSTVTVSTHGACVLLSTDIDTQKPALLINAKTKDEAQCRVVHRREVENGRREIGFDFETPHPKIWGIGFPPDDWDPADRKRPAFAQKSPLPLSKGNKK